jgi:DtxR family Mn-dependent transcriptional regulator
MSQETITPVEDRPSQTIEDYLGIIYVMERDAEPVIAARLADTLEVSAPTVTNTLKRMARDGWVMVDPQKSIHLTPNGQAAARSLIRRHMLTEWMLARVLNVPWSQVHQEAHQIEHSLSPDLEDRLKTRMDDPQTCPHGNPLPGYEYVTEQWICLQDIPVNKKVIIRRIHENAENHPEILNYLESNGIVHSWPQRIVYHLTDAKRFRRHRPDWLIGSNNKTPEYPIRFN